MVQRLVELLRSEPNVNIPRDHPGVDIYHLPQIGAYLKIGSLDQNSHLWRERDVIQWLTGKFEVPTVLDYELVDHCECLLISEVRGETYADQIARATDKRAIRDMVAAMAAEIRRLHDLPIENCFLDQRLDVKLDQAQRNINGGFVLESDFDEDNLGKSGQQVLKELLLRRPMDEDLVFTHGDLCLPNIMVRNGRLQGLIDLGRGGVADRYQDIALFLRSFRFNSPQPVDIENIFCEGYGIPFLEQDKLDYYRHLDELF